MIATDEPAFSQIFRLLADTLGSDVSPGKVSGYFSVLRTLRLEAVQAGAHRLMAEWKGLKFPTPADWIDAAEAAERESLRQVLPAGRVEPWHVECEQCEDTGFVAHVCTAEDRCGRSWCAKYDEVGQTAHTHRYVSVCVCRPTNRTWARHHPLVNVRDARVNQQEPRRRR